MTAGLRIKPHVHRSRGMSGTSFSSGEILCIQCLDLNESGSSSSFQTELERMFQFSNGNSKAFIDRKGGTRLLPKSLIGPRRDYGGEADRLKIIARCDHQQPRTPCRHKSWMSRKSEGNNVLSSTCTVHSFGFNNIMHPGTCRKTTQKPYMGALFNNQTRHWHLIPRP